MPRSKTRFPILWYLGFRYTMFADCSSPFQLTRLNQIVCVKLLCALFIWQNHQFINGWNVFSARTMYIRTTYILFSWENSTCTFGWVFIEFTYFQFGMCKTYWHLEPVRHITIVITGESRHTRKCFPLSILSTMHNERGKRRKNIRTWAAYERTAHTQSTALI